MATTSAGDHSDELAEFGYKQELDRSIGRFASFAAGVSYISILTGVFQLFYFGFAFGGPAYWWTWPMVFVGQLMVALCFAELAANFPVAGSIYNWGKMLASATVAWLGGWMMLTASIVTIAAVALAYQITLPEISDFFWFYGDGSGDNDFAINAVILGSVLIIFTTLINALGVKLMSRINSTGVFIELIAAVVLIVALLASATRGPDVVFETHGTGAGHEWGYFGAFLAASLASAYVMYGFDTASSLGEETHEPRKTAPIAIMRAVIASFVLGGLIILFAMMAVGNINAPQIGEFGGLQYIILDVFGDTVGKIFLICVVIAVTVCCLAVHTATIRMAFAMARDNNLPAGERVATVHPKTKTPIVPAVISGVLAILILVVNIGNDQIFTVITSIGIIMIYIAYLLVTVPMLGKRFKGEWPPKHPRGPEVLHARQAGAADQPARRRLGHLHGDQPGLAAQGRLQRVRAVPLVPAVRRDPLHRNRLLRRPCLVLVRAAPQDRGAGLAPVRVVVAGRRRAVGAAGIRSLSTRMFIDGEWCDAASGATVEATSPATGESLGPRGRGRSRGCAARDRRRERRLPVLGRAHRLRARRAPPSRRRRVRAARGRARPRAHARPGQAAEGGGRGRGGRARSSSSAWPRRTASGSRARSRRAPPRAGACCSCGGRSACSA